jgi:hypothetical protein
MGNQLMEIRGESIETQIKLINQSSGLYLLRIAKKGRQKTYKIIIE